ncbi:MAG TPA: DUF4126 domain-containing protein [Steroidobacteraceae bacterium]
MDFALESLLSIALGLGLAAAAGFRVFVPLLFAGLAARVGWLELHETFAWLETTPALIMLGTAAIFETLAYYVPGVDHLLDMISGPVAVIAGAVASASVMTDIQPILLWPLAIIAGGGAAALTKGGSALIRAKTSFATAGLGNPVVSTAETASAAGLSMLAILVPILGLAVVIVLVVWGVRRTLRTRSARPKAED